MAKIIFRAPNAQRFQAPQPTSRQCWALILYRLTRIKTAPFREAMRAHGEAWRRHAERLQAELDAEHNRTYYIDGRTGRTVYR